MIQWSLLMDVSKLFECILPMNDNDFQIQILTSRYDLSFLPCMEAAGVGVENKHEEKGGIMQSFHLNFLHQILRRASNPLHWTNKNTHRLPGHLCDPQGSCIIPADAGDPADRWSSVAEGPSQTAPPKALPGRGTCFEIFSR